MSYLRQIPAMFSVDLTEFEAYVPVLISGNEKGLNVTELKEACENDKYSVTLLVDVTGETQDKLYFTKVAYSEENGGYLFAGGNDDINGLMIEFAETVTGMHMILLGFKGESGGLAVMSREEWNAVEKKNDYGLVAVLDYNDRYIAGSLYNGAYYVEGFFHAYFDNDIFITDNFETDTLPLYGIDEGGNYFYNSSSNYFSGHLKNAYPISTNEKLVIEYRVKFTRWNTINFDLYIGDGAHLVSTQGDVRIYNGSTEVFYVIFGPCAPGTIKKFKYVFSESENKMWVSIDDGQPAEYNGGTVINFYNNLKNNDLITINNMDGYIYDFKMYYE